MTDIAPKIVVPLLTALLLGVNISPILVDAQVEDEGGTTPSAQWSWTPALESTSCDGLIQLTVSHTPAGSSTTNLIFNKVSMPVIKAHYSDADENFVLIDQPGISGCTNNFNPPSFQIGGPDAVATGVNIPATKIFVRYFVGAACDQNFPNQIPYTCYKYEEIFWLYDSVGTTKPKFKHLMKAFGIGYADSDTPPPVYSAYFRVDTDVPSSSDLDKFQRKQVTATGTSWLNVKHETVTPLTEFDSNGAQWRTCNVPQGQTLCGSQKVTINPRANDNAHVYVLQFNPEDPTNNQQSDQEPSIWANCTDCLNPSNILYWYKTNRQATATECQPTTPCTMGPDLVLQGGI